MAGVHRNVGFGSGAEIQRLTSVHGGWLVEVRRQSGKCLTSSAVEKRLAGMTGKISAANRVRAPSVQLSDADAVRAKPDAQSETGLSGLNS